MYINVILIVLLLAGMVGIAALSLIVLISKITGDFSESSRNLRNFLISLFGLGIVFIVSNYGMNINVYEQTTIIDRGANVVLIGLTQVFWLFFLQSEIVLSATKKYVLQQVMSISMIITTLANVLIHGFFVDGEYNIVNEDLRVNLIFVASSITICQLILHVFCIVLAAKKIQGKLEKRFILTVQSLVILYVLTSGIVINPILIGQSEMFILTEIVSVWILVLNALTLFYVFKHDFSERFFANAKIKLNTGAIETDTKILDDISEKSKLTNREREVIGLSYDGKSYEEIAEELFISKFTVKNHMHNAYEKLEVASKNELLKLIKEYKNNKDNG